MELPIVIKVESLPWGKGITLWPFIIVEKDVRVFKHECMHWYQIKRMGFFKFYYSIIKEYIKHGMNDGPLEQECERYEEHPLTEQEEKWWKK